MGKKTDYPGISEADGILAAKVADAAEASNRDYRARFLGFLDGHQRTVASRAAQSAVGDAAVVFWGGYEGAERVYAGFFPPYEEPDAASFPICALRLSWKFGNLTHRDFLGALLALGIKREKIGDILVGDKVCDLVAERVIAGFITANLEKVGSSGVRCEPVELSKLERKQEFLEIGDTIASERLDCAVSALVNASRGEASRLIVGGSVSVDFETAVNPAFKLCGGSTVSIRGHGRFVIDAIGPETRKGRLRFAARKFR